MPVVELRLVVILTIRFLAGRRSTSAAKGFGPGGGIICLSPKAMRPRLKVLSSMCVGSSWSVMTTSCAGAEGENLLGGHAHSGTPTQVDHEPLAPSGSDRVRPFHEIDSLALL